MEYRLAVLVAPNDHVVVLRDAPGDDDPVWQTWAEMGLHRVNLVTTPLRPDASSLDDVAAQCLGVVNDSMLGVRPPSGARREDPLTALSIPGNGATAVVLVLTRPIADKMDVIERDLQFSVVPIETSLPTDAHADKLTNRDHKAALATLRDHMYTGAIGSIEASTWEHVVSYVKKKFLPKVERGFRQAERDGGRFLANAKDEEKHLWHEGERLWDKARSEEHRLWNDAKSEFDRLEPRLSRDVQWFVDGARRRRDDIKTFYRDNIEVPDPQSTINGTRPLARSAYRW